MGIGKDIVGEASLSEGLKLGLQDKKVIDAFLDKKKASGTKLTTDGTTLDGLWMGGAGIAKWEKGKIQMPDLGSKAAQTVQKAVAKKAPKNWLAEELLGEAARGIAKRFENLKVSIASGLLNRLKKHLNKPSKWRVTEMPRVEGAVCEFETTDAGDLPVEGSVTLYFGRRGEAEWLAGNIDVKHPQRGGGREDVDLGKDVEEDEALKTLAARVRELANLR